MSIQAQQGKADTINTQFNRFSGVLRAFICVLYLSLLTSLAAQAQEPVLDPASNAEQKPAEPIDEVTVSLPDSQQMAMALATPGLREQALLDLAVASNALSRAKDEIEVDHAGLAQNFLDDRAWLQMLVGRYGWVQPRSSVLDPAAWLVLGELQQHDLEDVALVFPGRTLESDLIYQVFQRSEQQLAAANLPILLLEIESDVITIWDSFLQLTGPQDSPDIAWKVVEAAWFSDRQIPATTIMDAKPQDHEPVITNIPQAMSQMVVSTVDAHPPDSRRLLQLRYSLLSKMPELAGEEYVYSRVQFEDSLYLVSIIDGLHAGRYFDFIQGLLSITSRQLEFVANSEDTFSMVDWLLTELPAISAHYAVDFAKVDPRLNAAMEAVYKVLQNVTRTAINDPEIDHVGIKASRAVLADAVAQLALLIPDMGYYFDTPVRARIVEEINICISIAASQDDDGLAAMTSRQFDACMDTLLQLADQETRKAELSGDMNGPFTIDTLRRELSISPWQRINYGIGYMHERYSSNCQPPGNPLPNPLEWAVLATSMTWLAEHSPEFFHTPGNETRLTKMRNIGEQLILTLGEQTSCLAAAGTGINDPIVRGMTNYELALRELDLGIDNAEADFRTRRLGPGADVSLERDAFQKTSYRPDGLAIEPCNTQAVCEMSGSLSTTRALIGLFPDEYLVAEQTGLGHIEICYRNMEWVQRRLELVRADDENVANYFGYLGFDLVGRYVENERIADIFAYRFTSPEEHHYLFAQTSDEVLNDSCPMEWVGSRVVTPLRENRGGLAPNRLTYLAASRSLPSRLLQNNWDRGAEWRDWFVTGIGVSALEVPPVPEIMSRLNQHLQSLYQAQQADIYQRVLLSNARNSQGDDVSLFNEMSQVSIAKALIRMQLILFYPESLHNSDSVRMAIAGDAGLLEGRTLRRFREDNIALTSVNAVALERLLKLRETWSKQPEAMRRQGSLSASLMLALTRINILYRRFFTSRPVPLQEIEATTKQAG